MTLILKSDQAMTNPGDAPVRPRGLPVPGAVARWIVSSLPVAPTIARWESAISTGPVLIYPDGSNTAPTMGIVDGIRAARFNGTSSGLSAPLALPQPHSLAMVVKTHVLDDTALRVLSGDQAVAGGVDDNASVYAFGDASNGTRSIRINAGSGPATSITPTDEWGVIVVVFDGSSSVVRLNAAEQTVNAGTKPREGITFGHYRSGRDHARMDLAEAAVYPFALTAAQRDATVAGLRASYGI